MIQISPPTRAPLNHMISLHWSVSLPRSSRLLKHAQREKDAGLGMHGCWAGGAGMTVEDKPEGLVRRPAVSGARRQRRTPRLRGQRVNQKAGGRD